MRNRYHLGAGLLFVFPAIAAACGSDGASDESFAADLCKATSQFQASAEAAIKDASSQTDASKAIERLIPPLEAFVEAFKDADPPEDLDAWHDDAAKQLQASLEKFKSEKTLASLTGFNESARPEPPADARARLLAAAETVEECEGVTFLGPD